MTTPPLAAPVLPDAAVDRVGYLLAAADLREGRADSASGFRVDQSAMGSGGSPLFAADREFTITEARPTHTLAEVALWRGIAGRHQAIYGAGLDADGIERERNWCQHDDTEWPCADLLAAVAAAQAYLTGAGT